MIKRIIHAYLGPIWYHSEPSEVPYSPNQFLGWNFFGVFYSKTAIIAPSKLYIPTSIYYKPMNEWYSEAELLIKGGEY